MSYFLKVPPATLFENLNTSGLEMSKDLDNLALTYLAVLQGLALGVGE